MRHRPCLATSRIAACLGGAYLVAMPALAQQPAQAGAQVTQPEPLAIGETFTMESKVLGETRRVNVYLPAGYAERTDESFPVLYMPDGGIYEDFHHIAGLLQISALNATMRSFLLVGVENTNRHRDLTPPTEVAIERERVPAAGGSAKFRAFFVDELRPVIDARYRTTDETALVGESFAGLFVVETLLEAPDLFDSYIAVDPSLWWNEEKLVQAAPAKLRAHAERELGAKQIYVATGDADGMSEPAQRLVAAFESAVGQGSWLTWHYEPMPAETHRTIFHPAALRAVRLLLAPPPEPPADEGG